MSADEERLMQLFQNRAGLKKAYADLKDEFHLLRDRLKQQEGATIRVQEQLDALGDLLADPRTGFGALVFFQLRGLWKICHQQLSAFAADITRQQEQRETAKHTADCEAAKNARLADVDQRLQAAAAEADAQRERAEQRAGRTAAPDRILALLRAPPAPEIARGAAPAGCARRCGGRGSARRAHARSARRRCGDFPGISLGARRNINLAIISYAESLCEHVDAFGLTARAKEAVARRVHEMSFGSRADCEGYMQRVQKAQAAIANHKQITAAVRVKLERLRAACEYRNTADTVPTADSLAAASAESGPANWNVLAEDYWDLYTLLLR